MTSRNLAPLALLVLAACGGGSTSPGPTPTAPTGTNSLTGVVFYDQNADGVLAADERVRVPGVRVTAGGQSGTSDATGRFTIASLPGGSLTPSVAIEALPPYFQVGAVASVTLPQPAGASAAVPLTLPIGRNQPNRYLAFGDSIVEGAGSSRREGWTTPLEARLRAHFGDAEMKRDGVYGARSIDGAGRIAGLLAEERPAYTLVLYGSNDWTRCQFQSTEACVTVAALREIIQKTKAAGSLPFVGTIIPVNPDYPDIRPTERNEWVREQNVLIRAMVPQEGAVLVDTAAVFGTDPRVWPPLFFDHVHPSEAAYRLIADAYFDAITRARAGR